MKCECVLKSNATEPTPDPSQEGSFAARTSTGPSSPPGRGQGWVRSSAKRRHHAFTLVELMLVVTIIGILAALVVPKMVGRSEQARQTAARADIAAFSTALDAFEVDNGYYPKGSAGLADLIAAPRDARGWHGPYVKEVSKDPWGNNYIYECPGRRNPNGYDLSSPGTDGRPNTEDDITNWTVKK